MPHLLLSASVDGLINSYDVRITDEDDAVLSTAQVGASVGQMGWMGLRGTNDLQGVWSATTIETVQFWDANDVRNHLISLHHFRDDELGFDARVCALVHAIGRFR